MTGKRVTDALGAFVVLFLAAPGLLVIWLAVRVRLGSPALFRQRRVGLGGTTFELLKFRSMSPDAGGAVSDESRLTRFGRWLRATSLDELPSFWNVLRGEMSLVGPRPLVLGYLLLYSPRQARRHEVRPGITGWAQVNGRNAVGWKSRLEMDVWYVENQSLLLDLKILAMTVVKVLRREGIAQPGHATMTPFRGEH